MEKTYFWFVDRRPDDRMSLAGRFRAAGHSDIIEDNSRVGMIPFEVDNDFFGWAASMQNHFGCELIEID
jgi:hypothetical protein